jgi:predicted permease
MAGVPALARAELDWRVLGFAVGVSALVAAVAGVFPALAGSRVRAAVTLREAGRSQTASRRRLRRALCTAQVVVSITLLVGAGLLARSMSARMALDPGFDPSRVLAFSVEPGLQGYGPRQEVFYRDLIDRVRVTPGVRAAGLAWLRPFSRNAADTAFKPEGAGDDAEVSAHLNAVSPGFFDAMGLRLVDGRDFNDSEFQRSATEGDAVAILTESLARRLFDGRPAVGRRLEGSFSGSSTRTIVGVVADTRQRRLDREQEDTLFEPFGQPFPTGWATMVVGLRSPDAGQTEIRSALRQVVTDLDPTLPIYDVTTLDAAILAHHADDLLVMRLTLTFALLATTLAAVGLYGVLARGVGERRHEIGIRTALGARPGAIAGLVTREAAGVLAWGLAIGLPLCWWLTRFLESRLFDVSRLDAVAFGGAVLLVVVVTIISALPAARRAARLDPASVLRT